MSDSLLTATADFTGRRLRCNGAPVAMPPSPMRESQEADDTEQRRRLDGDGYLFLRGALPIEQVTECRRQVLEVYREALQPGTALLEGLCADPIPPGVFTAANALRANRVPAYAALCHSAAVIGTHERLLGGLIHLHRRKIIRLLPPGGRVGDVHQDFCYLAEGTVDVLTSWIPLGDVPIEVGGLMVLEGSHVHGALPHCRQMAPPDAMREELGGAWRTADYRLGDMVIFRATLVHTGLDNVDGEGRRIRLSSDTRYQRVDAPLDPRWQNEWHPLDGL
jgi:hypothetical protein